MPPHLSPQSRSLILALRAQGLSIYNLASLFHVSPATISRTCQNQLKSHSPYSPTARRGRRPKLGLSDARFAMLTLARCQAKTAAELQREYFPEVHPDTVRRTLRKLGLFAYVRRRVPFLNYRHRKACIQWARDHRAWRMVNWRRVIFSDESKYKIFGSDGRQYCWRRPGEALDPRYTQKVVKHGGGSIMVWGCITARGVGRLCRIDGTMTAVKYTEILEDGLLGTLQDRKMRSSDFIFQHDNDPKHTSRHTKAWLSNHNLQVLPWPANSPDMNIIENLWEYLDRKVRARSVLPCNSEDLWLALKEEWEQIGQDVIDKLYDSLPARVEELIVARGGNTKY
jgi:transposase